MIRAILWDNDGVLVDTEHLYFLATQQILSTVGIELTEAMYRELFLVQARGAWHLAEEQGISGGEVEELKAQRGELYLRYLQAGTKPIDGVEDVLRRLRGTYVMGVVTSSHRNHFEAIHRITGLMQYFAFALTSEDYKHHKPDPEPYRLAVEKTGFRPDECIAIEDSERGLASARGAGIPCIVIPQGLTRSGLFEGATAVLRDVREIPAAIEEFSVRRAAAAD
ncbi:MAG TPA: HAD family phosphatase [Terriglobia bacterium]|nr:HAD family phosphatase [Terriglobia bacterium]